MRDAPNRELIADLLVVVATVTAYAPVTMEKVHRIFVDEPRLNYAENLIAALENADALVFVAQWKKFRSPDYDTIKKHLKNPVIFDGSNLYDPKLVRGMGIDDFSIVH